MWCKLDSVSHSDVRKYACVEDKKAKAIPSYVLRTMSSWADFCCFIFSLFERIAVESIWDNEIAIICSCLRGWKGPTSLWDGLPGLMFSSASFQMFTNSDEAVINKKLPKELLLRWVASPKPSVGFAAGFLRACCLFYTPQIIHKTPEALHYYPPHPHSHIYTECISGSCQACSLGHPFTLLPICMLNVFRSRSTWL